MIKEYGFNDLAGCVTQRISRLTGLKVGLYHSEQAGLDYSDRGTWTTVCEEHGCLVTHESLSLAKSHLADPAGWCEVCGAEEDRKLKERKI